MYCKLCLNQCAFQKLHNTVTCLLNVINPWLKTSDEGILLDLKKAFDTVDHKTLGRSYESMVLRVLPTTVSLLT